MKAERTSVFSNVIQRRRSKEGHPIPRHHVYTSPLVTHDPDALRAVAETSKESPEDAIRHMPWLMSMNAIAATENVKTLREDIVSEKNSRNDELKAEISNLKPELEKAKIEESSLSSSLSNTLALFGLAPRDEHPHTYIDEGLSSLEELAGEHDLPAPKERLRGIYGWLHRVTAILGGGTVFGVSLGLLTGTLELVSISEEWPWLLLNIAIGSAVMLMVGATLWPLGIAVGEGLYRIGHSTRRLKFLLPAIYILMIIGLAIAFVAIESKVEMLGLFKALNEENSLTNTALSKSDLLWASLTLSLPVVASYIVLGMVEGERKANFCKLSHFQAEQRMRILADAKFALACEHHQKLQKQAEHRHELAAKIVSFESAFETGFTTEELYRLEDMEMDAAAMCYAAERALHNSTKKPRLLVDSNEHHWWQGLWSKIRRARAQ